MAGPRRGELRTVRGVWLDGDSCAGDYWYDAEHAQFVVDFFARCLTHVEGEFAGQPFILSPWQAAPTRAIFGWKRLDNNLRRIKEVFIFVASGNGKSAWLSGLAIVLLGWDMEPVSAVYNLAGTREQAHVVFDTARKMVEADKLLDSRIECLKRSMRLREDDSSYQVRATDTGLREDKHGLRPHAVILDEVHAIQSRRMHDTLVNMTGKRRQPLILKASTAGLEKDNTLCGEEYDKACRIRDGLTRNDRYLALIYECPRDAQGNYIDWKSDQAILAANPNLGRAIKLENIREELQNAIDNPSEAPAYRRLRCNIWDKQISGWLAIEKLRACQARGALVDYARSLQGRSALGGLDVSDGRDLNSLALLFRPVPAEVSPEAAPQRRAGEAPPASPAPPPAALEPEVPPEMVPQLAPGLWQVLWRHWIPEDTLSESYKKTRQHARLYEPWARGCLCRNLGDARRRVLECPAPLHVMRGACTDFDLLRADINALAGVYTIEEIAVDKHGALGLLSGLEADGLVVFSHEQSCPAMNPGITELERVLLRGEIELAPDDVAAWTFSNVSLFQNAYGQKRFEKMLGKGQRLVARTLRKIDPWVALAMPVGRAALAEPPAAPSIFLV